MRAKETHVLIGVFRLVGGLVAAAGGEEDVALLLRLPGQKHAGRIAGLATPNPRLRLGPILVLVPEDAADGQALATGGAAGVAAVEGDGDIALQPPCWRH